MKTIFKYLNELYPDHPEDIVLHNKIYPSGLKEIDIYNYYIENKKKILDWIDNRYVAFFINIGDKIVVKRNIDNRKIKLTNENFDTIINGRTNVIFVEYPSVSNYMVIDLDIGLNITPKQIKDAVKYICSYKPIITLMWDIEAIRSSERGVHIIGYTEKRTIKQQRKMLLEALHSIGDLKLPLIVDTKGRHPDTINLDLTPMNDQGLHICKYSLTKEGLICDDFSKPLRKVK